MWKAEVYRVEKNGLKWKCFSMLFVSNFQLPGVGMPCSDGASAHDNPKAAVGWRAPKEGMLMS